MAADEGEESVGKCVACGIGGPSLHPRSSAPSAVKKASGFQLLSSLQSNTFFFRLICAIGMGGGMSGRETKICCRRMWRAACNSCTRRRARRIASHGTQSRQSKRSRRTARARRGKL